jgi:hypothetical protein
LEAFRVGLCGSEIVIIMDRKAPHDSQDGEEEEEDHDDLVNHGTEDGNGESSGSEQVQRYQNQRSNCSDAATDRNVSGAASMPFDSSGFTTLEVEELVSCLLSFDDHFENVVRSLLTMFPGLEGEHAMVVASALLDGGIDDLHDLVREAAQQTRCNSGAPSPTLVAFQELWNRRPNIVQICHKCSGGLRKDCGCLNNCRTFGRPRIECDCKNECKRCEIPRILCECRNICRKCNKPKAGHECIADEAEQSKKRSALEIEPKITTGESTNNDEYEEDDRKPPARRKRDDESDDSHGDG